MTTTTSPWDLALGTRSHRQAVITCADSREAAFAARAQAGEAAYREFAQKYSEATSISDRRVASEELRVALSANHGERSEILDQVWVKLLEDVTGDPTAEWMVRWGYESDGEFDEEILAVLGALPASLGQLDAMAQENNWCEHWSRAVRAAIEDGVLPSDIDVTELYGYIPDDDGEDY